jgi:hypothetical protein
MTTLFYFINKDGRISATEGLKLRMKQKEYFLSRYSVLFLSLATLMEEWLTAEVSAVNS